MWEFGNGITYRKLKIRSLPAQICEIIWTIVHPYIVAVVRYRARSVPDHVTN